MSLPDTPLVGISLLTTILIDKGHTCKLIDLNILLYRSGIYQSGEWDSSFAKFTNKTSFEGEYQKIRHFIDYQITQIIQNNPQFVGIGVFTKSNEYVTYAMCSEIRRRAPHIKLFIGGIYCDQIGPDLLASNLIDFYLNGPAEKTILDLAENKTTNVDGINNLRKGAQNFDSLPLPDYSQLDLTMYRAKNIYVVGSRGCPYRCTFCGVTPRWGKFQTRKITDILNEIESLYLTYNITYFLFTDSLVNGDLRYFRKLCIAINELSRKYDNVFMFEWFLSIRNEHQMPPSDFDLLGAVNIHTIKLGVESGSPTVLSHIRKGFKLPDLFYFLSELDRVSIKCDLLFFTGYPTETDQDFLMSLQLLDQLVKYRRIINYIRVTPMCVEEGTPIFKMGYPLGATTVGIDRYEKFKEKIFQLGFNIRCNTLITNIISENKKFVFKDITHEPNYFSRAKSK